MSSTAEALNAGFAFHVRGELAQAETTYRQVLAREPDNARALQMLGVLALQTARLPEALALLERAVAIEPGGDVLANLASAYVTAGRFADALRTADRALAIEPGRADALENRGLAMMQLGRPEEAVICLERSLAARPDHANTHSNLGVAYQAVGRLDDAERSLTRALELDPRNVVAHFNLGTVAKDRGDPAAAIGHYDRALSINPNYAQALAARGAALLSLGEFVEGWQLYEHRAGCPQFQMLRLATPAWDGSPLAGRTLLVHCEQGFGDTLQFIRYLKPPPAGGKVVIAAPAALIPLLAQSGFDGLVALGDRLPPFDVHAPLLSLPRILGTRENTIPRNVPYLAARPERREHWRARLAGYAGLKVGIACQGRKEFQGDRFRSIPPEAFAPLATIPGVRLVSLQRKPALAELAAGPPPFEVLDFGAVLDEPAFVELAALVENIDLVVTSDTGVAHLAGALGARVWLALAFAPDWRWLIDRRDSPWYPTMRLFRQQRRGDWGGVFAEIAGELRALAQAR